MGFDLLVPHHCLSFFLFTSQTKLYRSSLITNISNIYFYLFSISTLKDLSRIAADHTFILSFLFYFFFILFLSFEENPL